MKKNIEQSLLSVIVPVYKVEEHLHKCVNSILEQNYQNIELILVDDGSPDNCPRICDEYARSDNRIKVIHKPNGGLSSARNAGLQIASGDYIGFVDSDDWVEKISFSKMMHYAIKDNLDICAASYRYIRPWKIENKILESESDGSYRIIDNITALNELYFGPQQFVGISIMVWTKIYKSDLLQNRKFSEGYIFEDTEFTPLILHSASKIGVLNKTFYNYNIHLGINSTSGMRTNMMKIRSKIFMSKSVFRYFNENYIQNISERATSIYLNNLLSCYYESKKNKWEDLCNEIMKDIAEFKKSKTQYIIKTIKNSRQYKIFKNSPTLFCILKNLVQKSKLIKYRVYCFITKKN